MLAIASIDDCSCTVASHLHMACVPSGVVAPGDILSVRNAMSPILVECDFSGIDECPPQAILEAQVAEKCAGGPISLLKYPFDPLVNEISAKTTEFGNLTKYEIPTKCVEILDESGNLTMNEIPTKCFENENLNVIESSRDIAPSQKLNCQAHAFAQGQLQAGTNTFNGGNGGNANGYPWATPMGSPGTPGYAPVPTCTVCPTAVETVAGNVSEPARMVDKNPRGCVVEEIVLEPPSRMANLGRQKKIAGRHSEAGIGGIPYCRISMIRGNRGSSPENEEVPHGGPLVVPPRNVVAVPMPNQLQAVPPPGQLMPMLTPEQLQVISQESQLEVGGDQVMDLSQNYVVNNNLTMVQNVLNQNLRPPQESGENLALQAAAVAGQAVGHAEATRSMLAPVVSQCQQFLQQMDGRMQEIAAKENNTTQYLELLAEGIREAFRQITEMHGFAGRMGEGLQKDIKRAFDEIDTKSGDIWVHLNLEEPQMEARMVEVENDISNIHENLNLHAEFEDSMQKKIVGARAQISEAHQSVKNWAMEVTKVQHQFGVFQKDFEGVQQASNKNVAGIAEINAILRSIQSQNELRAQQISQERTNLAQEYEKWAKKLEDLGSETVSRVVGATASSLDPPGSVMMTQDPFQQAQLATMRAEIEAMNAKISAQEETIAKFMAMKLSPPLAVPTTSAIDLPPPAGRPSTVGDPKWVPILGQTPGMCLAAPPTLVALSAASLVPAHVQTRTDLLSSTPEGGKKALLRPPPVDVDATAPTIHSAFAQALNVAHPIGLAPSGPQKDVATSSNVVVGNVDPPRVERLEIGNESNFVQECLRLQSLDINSRTRNLDPPLVDSKFQKFRRIDRGLRWLKVLQGTFKSKKGSRLGPNSNTFHIFA